jgi:hypothetical protein
MLCVSHQFLRDLLGAYLFHDWSTPALILTFSHRRRNSVVRLPFLARIPPQSFRVRRRVVHPLLGGEGRGEDGR